MAFVTRFEDIQGWQEARKLVRMIYKLINSCIFAKNLVFVIRSNVQPSHRYDQHPRRI
jgi:hypothetical protein